MSEMAWPENGITSQMSSITAASAILALILLFPLNSVISYVLADAEGGLLYDRGLRRNFRAVQAGFKASHQLAYAAPDWTTRVVTDLPSREEPGILRHDFTISDV